MKFHCLFHLTKAVRRFEAEQLERMHAATGYAEPAAPGEAAQAMPAEAAEEGHADQAIVFLSKHSQRCSLAFNVSLQFAMFLGGSPSQGSSRAQKGTASRVHQGWRLKGTILEFLSFIDLYSLDPLYDCW